MFPIQLLIAEKRSPNEKGKGIRSETVQWFSELLQTQPSLIAAVFHVNSTDGSFESKSLTQKDVTT